MSEDEPLLALISFDGKTAVMAQIDEAVEQVVSELLHVYSILCSCSARSPR